MAVVSLVITYYDQPNMLDKQVENWLSWSSEIQKEIRVILVDDGSPKTAASQVIRDVPEFLSLYRILEDIPWNHPGARNLGIFEAQTPWILSHDLDHVVPENTLVQVLKEVVVGGSTRFYYTFPRVKVVTGESIRPNTDQFLISRRKFWESGGYDEDFRGAYGGVHTAMQRAFWNTKIKARHLNGFPLLVYSKGDASVRSLSRPRRGVDPKNKLLLHRKLKLEGEYKAVNPLRFKWERVSL